MCSVQVRDFNDPASKCSVFLLSVRAGGVGVNLQAADTIIMCAYLPDSEPSYIIRASEKRCKWCIVTGSLDTAGMTQTGTLRLTYRHRQGHTGLARPKR